MDEEKVWQRVFSPGGPQADRAGLTALCAEAARTAALCRSLAGPLGQQVRQLQEENHQCLRGLCRLAGASVPGNARSVPGGEPVKAVYTRCRQAMTEYAARSAEREYGAVFQRLAENEALCLSLLARLAGQQPPGA